MKDPEAPQFSPDEPLAHEVRPRARRQARDLGARERDPGRCLATRPGVSYSRKRAEPLRASVKPAKTPRATHERSSATVMLASR
jgi:hypothetical protein